MVLDESIIAALVAKDYNGLELLIDKYGLTILKTIHQILNRSEERSYQQEVENEVFYTIWKKSATYKPELAQFNTWILMITKNTAIDFKRKIIRNQKFQSVATLPEIRKESFPLEKEQFLDLLAILTFEDQLIFLKRYFYQEKIEDIAKDLALTNETVYNRLSRGRKKLKKELSNHE
ncbi:RNA polymerase sigma factor (sigma-70 family) [Enterococcus sp. PF1-24]|uniref:sigma-70 family RNA polymerase sigma factor n=1 Tax=unclassified Enterococcus TaxID=2608891 RepID=UPI0024767638|nr:MULTISPECIES: sigma-70 family RNA polymerase sigma factor [unclassified Enterococcus]MDH6364022.1 RNA polymerase sigma factor (sigma-70 family) [Enterococcus sp. PFB1-1]MDH6401123.1 RNA polymerase sigma factor (sigma-70 family) [Enterococcus sp. PF1-24]